MSPGSTWGSWFWNSAPASAIVELVFFLGGGLVYARATRPVSKWGTWGLWGFMGLGLAAYLPSLSGQAPPGMGMVATTLVGGQLIFVLAAWWLDSRRRPV